MTKCILFIFSIIIVYGYFVEPYLITVKNITVHSEKLANVLRGYKIIQLSDLHISNYGKREEKIIKILKEIDPDIVFFTGDAIAWGADFVPVLKFFEKVPARFGIWGVLGNADYSNQKGMCLLCHKPNSKILRKKSHIKLLRNKAEVIEISSRRNMKLAIIGIDDSVTGRDKLEHAISQIHIEIPKILLSHSPEIFEKAVEKNIDIVLAGHTHGGQIYLFSLLRTIVCKLNGHNFCYTKGLYQRSKTFMYVNRGIGTSVIPFRIGLPPEITIFKFE